jgi:hypothetical protein
MRNWCILWSFGKFVVIWYVFSHFGIYFPFLVCCTVCCEQFFWKITEVANMFWRLFSAVKIVH